MALSPAPKPGLLRQQLRSRRNRHLENVEGYRDERVIADETGQVDQPALAEALLDLFKEAVIDAMIAVVSAAEIIDELLVYDFCSTYYRNHGVDDGLFEKVKQRFGERGLVDLTGLIGYYSFVSVTLNVFEVPVPAGAQLLPK